MYQVSLRLLNIYEVSFCCHKSKSQSEAWSIGRHACAFLTKELNEQGNEYKIPHRLNIIELR